MGAVIDWIKATTAATTVHQPLQRQYVGSKRKRQLSPLSLPHQTYPTDRQLQITPPPSLPPLLLEKPEAEDQALESLTNTPNQPDRSSETSLPSSQQQHLPLTQRNLCLLRSTMSQPVTPKASKSKASQSRTTSTHAYDIRVMLERNNVFMQDRAAARNNPHVEKWAKEISQAERHSPNTVASAHKTPELIDRYESRNEDTFLRQVWGKLFRESREVKDEVEQTNVRAQLSDLQPAAWTSKRWDVDHLDENWKQPFQRARGPDPTSSNDLNSIPNSVPDIAYGISRDAFSPAELEVVDSLARYTGISRGLVCPSMLVEAKTTGDPGVVKSQCARCGALTVRSMRHILLAFGDTSVLRPGAETKTAVFSLSLTAQIAAFYVHWAEVKPALDGQLPLVKYHMTNIAAYPLENVDNPILTRQTLNSILDWATLGRKHQLKALFQSMIGVPLAISIDNVVDVDDEEEMDDEEEAQAAEETGDDELAPGTPALGFQNGTPSKKRKVDTGDH